MSPLLLEASSWLFFNPSHESFGSWEDNFKNTSPAARVCEHTLSPHQETKRGKQQNLNFFFRLVLSKRLKISPPGRVSSLKLNESKHNSYMRYQLMFSEWNILDMETQWGHKNYRHGKSHHSLLTTTNSKSWCWGNSPGRGEWMWGRQ